MKMIETGVAAVLGGFVALGLSLFASDLFVGGRGDVGPAGVAGPAGAVGPQGAVGPAGEPGPAGGVGPQGLAGPQGVPGEPGPAGETGPAGAVGPAGAAGAGDLGQGAVVLVRSASACPTGWAPVGQVRLQTSPEYPMTPDQTASNPGVFTSETMGWSNVNFFLCARRAE
jgi:hypothetical protein